MSSIEERAFNRLWECLTQRRRELIEKVLSSRTDHFTVAVDDVKKEHNSGALIRTCENLGINNIHIVDPEFRSTSAKNISIGSEKWVNQYLYDSWLGENGCIQKLKSLGYQIVATSPQSNGIDLESFDPKSKSAILFGNEADGLPPEVVNSADKVIFISTPGFSESLNVSVSAGIILYELIKMVNMDEDGFPELSQKESIKNKLTWTIKSIPNGEKIYKRLLKEEQQ